MPKLAVDIPEELFIALAVFKAQSQRKLKEVVAEAIREYLDRRRGKA